MRIRLFTLFLLLPLFALGQQENDNPNNSKNALDQKINTTLINDTETHKSVLNIKKRKPQGLTLTQPNRYKFKLLNEQDVKNMEYNPKPIKQFKKKESAHIEI